MVAGLDPPDLRRELVVAALHPFPKRLDRHQKSVSRPSRDSDPGETTHADYSFRPGASRRTLTGLRRQVIGRIHAVSLIQAGVDQFKSWGFSGSVLCGLALLKGVDVET